MQQESVTMKRSFHFLYLILIVVLFLTASACQTKYVLPDSPEPLPAYLPPKTPVRLALVLGGGGARGLAHVGVLEEFERADIPIDLIIGCSSGSIVGALYANHPHAYYIKTLVEKLKRNDLIDINLFDIRYGLTQGKSLKKFLCKYLGDKEFNQLHIPLLIVATDLLEGELVCLGGGPVIPAVHASCAYPLYFTPVEIYGRVLVDGGVVDPIPVEIARQNHAEIIVAVDLSELLPKTSPANLFGVAKRCAEIKFFKQSESCIKGADIIIRPEIRHIGTFDDKCNQAIYEAGRLAARQALPEILEALRQKGL